MFGVNQCVSDQPAPSGQVDGGSRVRGAHVHDGSRSQGFEFVPESQDEIAAAEIPGIDRNVVRWCVLGFFRHARLVRGVRQREKACRSVDATESLGLARAKPRLVITVSPNDPLKRTVRKGSARLVQLFGSAMAASRRTSTAEEHDQDDFVRTKQPVTEHACATFEIANHGVDRPRSRIVSRRALHRF